MIDYLGARDTCYDVTRLSKEKREDSIQIINSTLAIKTVLIQTADSLPLSRKDVSFCSETRKEKTPK